MDLTIMWKAYLTFIPLISRFHFVVELKGWEFFVDKLFMSWNIYIYIYIYIQDSILNIKVG